MSIGSLRLFLVALLAAVPAVAGSTARAATAPNPFPGASLYVDPGSHAHRQAVRWRKTRPSDAAAMDMLASAPQAVWFGDWNRDVRGDVAALVNAAAAAHAVPVLVAYDIPKRDCGGYSAGGATSPARYRRWIRRFAAALGTSPAAVILEPDALPGLDCLKPRDRRVRLRLLRAAVATLRSRPGVAVYIDAGHEGWHAPRTIASRLSAAGVRRARGFSLNVSNFDTTASEIAYGNAISDRLGGKPLVIDTSRNGAGPTRDRQWCNPPGRALGRRPTAQTGSAAIDAFLWVKTPGESDGRCNGGPAAGVWWPEYALGLARRAGW